MGLHTWHACVAKANTLLCEGVDLAGENARRSYVLIEIAYAFANGAPHQPRWLIRID